MLKFLLIIPLVGAVLNGLVLRSRNAKIAGGLASLAAILSFFIALKSWFDLSVGSVLVEPWFTWFEVGTLKIAFDLEVTSLTGVMLLVITGIGSLIHIYATAYMDHDESPYRFFAYLNLFLVAMLCLVLSPTLVGVFLGWEGVGLCSYLLIGFWYKDDQNAAAGMKAFLVNRIGDLGFLLAMFIAFKELGTLRIDELLAAASEGRIPLTVLLGICFGIFWASTGKSAQIPLFVWLPDAMAGPTPVSALIHAATMVTSGLFVSARLWPLFDGVPLVKETILWVGISTALFSALIALTQRDIKKVLAYSTVSQLGFMFAAVGAGSPVAAFFHVVTHACFKALLFLGAGSVIHGMHHEQDLFKMGGLKSKMPVTHATFLIGTLAIIGFPLSSGFFSKDMILAKVYMHSPIAYVFLLSAALLTAFYMLRAYALCFWGKARSDQASHAHESPVLMTLPLVVLAALSAFVGFLEVPHVFWHVQKFTAWVEGSWYGRTSLNEAHQLSVGIEWGLMILSTTLSLGVAFYSFKRYRDGKVHHDEPKAIEKLSFNKFYVDEIYQGFFVRPLHMLAHRTSRVVDGWILNPAAHLLRDSTRLSGEVLSLFHTGALQTYAWYVALGATLALFVWGVLGT